MKQVIFSNWNFMRFMRLAIGLGILLQSVFAKDILFGLAGLMFTGMAVFNIACCGMGGCPTSYTNYKTDQKLPKDIQYEEVVK